MPRSARTPCDPVAPLGADTQVGDGYLSAMTLNASRAARVRRRGVQSVDSNMTRANVAVDCCGNRHRQERRGTMEELACRQRSSGALDEHRERSIGTSDARRETKEPVLPAALDSGTGQAGIQFRFLERSGETRRKNVQKYTMCLAEMRRHACWQS